MPDKRIVPRIVMLISCLFLLLTQSAMGDRGTLPDFIQLVQENGKAVVNVSSIRLATEAETAEPPQGAPEGPNEQPFNDYFRRYFDHPPGGAPLEPVHSVGSGFILSHDGYVLTNAHVVKDAQSLVVRLSDRREQPATLVGFDERSDVALLKIDAPDLPTVKIGDSDRLQVGEWVLAIGSPFGLEHTATQGIVSALGRNLPSESYVPFIQTDVAVNPGNSGGPLFNTKGEVVGINSQIYSNTGGYMGLSFAIPINVAMNVVAQLKQQGHVTRGWLGVLVQPVDQELAEAFGLDRPRGALVTEVIDDSPAAAKLHTGDIILSFDDRDIDEAGRLPKFVADAPVGKTVSMTILREGRQHHVSVAIGELDKPPQAQAPQPQENARLGLALSELSNTQREELKLGQRGVRVEGVNPGPAATAGIIPGDIILKIDHSEVASVQGLNEIVARLPTSALVPVLVQRGQTPMFLVFRLSPDR